MAIANPVTGGNTVIVALLAGDISGTLNKAGIQGVTLKDNFNDVWVQIANVVQAPGTLEKGAQVLVFMKANATAGATILTMNWPSALGFLGSADLQGLEISGLAAAQRNSFIQAFLSWRYSANQFGDLR